MPITLITAQAMTQMMPDDLWREFPKTATEFEARFATEEDCRDYWIKARWGGKPACAHCNSTRVWTIREGTTFECADCGHQTSLTSGTLLEKTRKPLKMWFRAIFEISTRRTGISGKDLQRIMGFGYLETQQKIQVHYLMWLSTAVVFAFGVVAFLWDFAAAGPPRGTARVKA